MSRGGYSRGRGGYSYQPPRRPRMDKEQFAEKSKNFYHKDQEFLVVLGSWSFLEVEEVDRVPVPDGEEEVELTSWGRRTRLIMDQQHIVNLIEKFRENKYKHEDVYHFEIYAVSLMWKDCVEIRDMASDYDSDYLFFDVEKKFKKLTIELTDSNEIIEKMKQCLAYKCRKIISA